MHGIPRMGEKKGKKNKHWPVFLRRNSKPFAQMVQTKEKGRDTEKRGMVGRSMYCESQVCLADGQKGPELVSGAGVVGEEWKGWRSRLTHMANAG